EWLSDEHMAGVERLRGDEWHQVEYLESEGAKRIFGELFTAWAKTRSKAYLYREGQRRHIPIAPINSPADLLDNRQLAYRQYFVEVMHALRDRPLIMPGAPYKLTETPWRIQRPAPALGEHNAEIYAEIGVDRAALTQLYAQRIV